MKCLRKVCELREVQKIRRSSIRKGKRRTSRRRVEKEEEEKEEKEVKREEVEEKKLRAKKTLFTNIFKLLRQIYVMKTRQRLRIEKRVFHLL